MLQRMLRRARHNQAESSRADRASRASRVANGTRTRISARDPPRCREMLRQGEESLWGLHSDVKRMRHPGDLRIRECPMCRPSGNARCAGPAVPGPALVWVGPTWPQWRAARMRVPRLAARLSLACARTIALERWARVKLRARARGLGWHLSSCAGAGRPGSLPFAPGPNFGEFWNVAPFLTFHRCWARTHGIYTW